MIYSIREIFILKRKQDPRMQCNLINMQKTIPEFQKSSCSSSETKKQMFAHKDGVNRNEAQWPHRTVHNAANCSQLHEKSMPAKSPKTAKAKN